MLVAAVLGWGMITAEPTEASLKAALEQARQALKLVEQAVVRVEPGRIHLSEPIVIGPDLSGLRLEADPAGEVILDGGWPDLEWTVEKDGTWSVRLPGGYKTRQLFVGGRRADRAGGLQERAFHYMESVKEDVLVPGDRAPKRAIQRIGISDELRNVLNSATKEQIAEADLMIISKWDDTRRPFSFQDGMIVTEGAGMKPWNSWEKGRRIWIENLRSDWDEPGEWIQEPGGKIHYRPLPGEDPMESKPSVPRIGEWLVIKGTEEDPVRGLVIDGIRFEHSEFRIENGTKEAAQAASNLSAAFIADFAENMVITNCTFAHTGEYAVWLRRGCRSNVISQSVVQDMGCGGIRIGETAAQAETMTEKNVVDDTIVQGGGRLAPSAVGIWIGASPDNVVSHCDISDLYYTGVSIGWRWGYAESPAKRNQLLNSRISHIGHGLLSDMGGIYTLGPSEGTTIKGCVFHDIESASYGGWGLYTDEGSTGVTFEDCLVYNTTSGGFHQHYGKENLVKNCILAFARDQALQATRVEPHLSFTMQSCVILANQEPFLSGRWKEIKTDLKDLLWVRLDGEPHTWLGEQKSTWVERWQAKNWIVGASPFVNAIGRDFTIASQSDLDRIGFVPFDTSKAGLRSAKMRHRLEELTH
jgi:hypothetical protein